MMKKISYALLGTALLTSVAAQAEDAAAHAPISAAAPTSACNFSGFYAGLGLGYGATKHDYKSERLTAGVSSQNTHENYAANGVTGGIFAGYGKEMGSSRVYLGLEAAYLFASEKSQNLFGGFKKKDGFELALRLGMAMNNALPYLKIGFASTKFDVEGKLLLADNSARIIHKKSKRLSGFLIGAGIDLKMSRNVMMGLAYTYTMYKDLKSGQLSPDNAAPPTAPTAGDHVHYKNKPASHGAMLRIAYTF
ncbi:MAG: outer membrane protein [Alphaproteobacteria bacterium]